MLISSLTLKQKCYSNDIGIIYLELRKQSRDFKNLKDFFGSVNLLYVDKRMLKKFYFNQLYLMIGKSKEASALIESDKGNVIDFLSLVDDILKKTQLINLMIHMQIF